MSARVEPLDWRGHQGVYPTAMHAAPCITGGDTGKNDDDSRYDESLHLALPGEMLALRRLRRTPDRRIGERWRRRQDYMGFNAFGSALRRIAFGSPGNSDAERSSHHNRSHSCVIAARRHPKFVANA